MQKYFMLTLCVSFFILGISDTSCLAEFVSRSRTHHVKSFDEDIIVANTIPVKKENTLEIFVMSFCPFAQMAESDILQHISSESGANMASLEIRYIFYKQLDEGEDNFSALHGEREVSENLVQMIIRENFPAAYHDYLLMRVGNNETPWEVLARGIGMTSDDIEYIQLRMDSEGDQLIEEEYQYVAGLYHVYDGSPAFFWESTRIRDLRQVAAFKEIKSGSGKYFQENGGAVSGEPAVGMSNPAAIYCKELGYEYQIVRSDEGDHGVCILPGGTCEEWDFLIGRCGREYSYCAMNGYDLVVKNDGKDSISREYAVCLLNGAEVGKVSELMSLSEQSTVGFVAGDQTEQANQDDMGLPDPHTVPYLDWRNHNDQDWMTGVRNQGLCGSCWAFSATGVVEAQYNIDANNPDLDIDLSEQYLVSDCFTYNDISNCCGGWKNRAIEFIISDGVPDESCLPYADGNGGCSCPVGYQCTSSSGCPYNDPDLAQCSHRTCSDRCTDWAQRLYHAISVEKVTEHIRQHLIDHGPLAISMGYGYNYGGTFDDNGVYRCQGKMGTNHAVSIVGFDDAGEYWIVKNSWGTGYHDNGYFKLGYGECASENFVYYTEATTSHTVRSDLTCLPGTGTIPFATMMSVTLANIYPDQIRRIAARLNVTLANESYFPSWRAGYTNVAAGDSFTTSWVQDIPALSMVVGDNRFALSVADVTPPPFNQPPYVPAGDTNSAMCTVRGIDP